MGSTFRIQNGIVSTATTQSDGGNITIKAGSLVELDHSQITTSVQGGLGSGGNITIDPPAVILDGSKIIASAIGGNGGNINIVASFFLMSPDSVIDASSSFGVSGSITIESPITNLSSTLAPLSQGFLKVPLMQSRCAARFQSGQLSSLVITGRDSIPSEPGNLLSSSLYKAETSGYPSASGKMTDLHTSEIGLGSLAGTLYWKSACSS
jgi:large exoprotein involved in heme utilization and adhesion